MATVHVYPARDTAGHTSAEDCPCDPDWTLDHSTLVPSWVLVHQLWDTQHQPRAQG